MKFKIRSVKTLKGTEYLYLDVEFVKGAQVIHRNDFVMQVPQVRRHYYGEVGPDGEILEPEKFTVERSDAVGVILGNIRAYLGRVDLEKAPFDLRLPGVETDETDPRGLLGRLEIQAIIGVDLEVAG